MATVSLKLLVDNSTEKVIFAEAGKDFVDFLFGLLEIPLGSLLNLLAKESMCESWSLSKVYESVNELGNEYLQPDQTKKSLLNPDMPFSNTKGTPLMQQLGYQKSQSSSSSNYYGSSRRDDRKEVDGYVKESVTYMISDDLTVKPVSSISTISLINSLGVKDIGTLEEKIVDIDMKKALELVRTSFGSSTVLTDVFVEKTMKKCEIVD
ncbi:putative DNA polymerase zeta catalytic subunit [Heracleum sosnowskyi]|uniref:DNA polymerase zeta catalytic subunit n=1 Tax=Heracleum sosnowskyi TaxID=360622 RepID=A0AAD8MI74_9APIA|nr:putative DNA polymerase zeta catalytic subunit [Heracleum sosnowskyi]